MLVFMRGCVGEIWILFNNNLRNLCHIQLVRLGVCCPCERVVLVCEMWILLSESVKGKHSVVCEVVVLVCEMWILSNESVDVRHSVVWQCLLENKLFIPVFQFDDWNPYQ